MTRDKWLRELDALAWVDVLGMPEVGEGPNQVRAARVPRFTRSIADAWMLAEKMEVGGFHLMRHSDMALADPWWVCEFGARGGAVEASTAPLAITMAALAALKIEIPPEPETMEVEG